MLARLITGALLTAVLLLHCPAQAQELLHASEQTPTASMGKNSIQMGPSARLDMPQHTALEPTVQRGFSAGSIASKLIDVIAQKNSMTLEEMTSGPLDAYLRPPQPDFGGSGLFNQAKSIYDDATTLHSENAEVRVDPLSMRWAVRINLNRLLSN